MGAAIIPLMIGGTLLEAESQRTEAEAKSSYYLYQARQAEGQARLEEIAGKQTAKSVKDAAAHVLARQGRNVRQLRGAQVAAVAEKGVSGGTTAEAIAKDTESQARIDELAIRFNADAESQEILRRSGITAFNLRSEAGGFREASASAKRAGKRRAFTTLLGGATSVALFSSRRFRGGR